MGHLATLIFVVGTTYNFKLVSLRPPVVWVVDKIQEVELLIILLFQALVTSIRNRLYFRGQNFLSNFLLKFIKKPAFEISTTCVCLLLFSTEVQRLASSWE